MLLANFAVADTTSTASVTGREAGRPL